MWRIFSQWTAKPDHDQPQKGQIRMRKLYNLARDNHGKGRGLKVVAQADSDEASVYVYDAIGGWFGISAEEFVKEIEAITASTIRVYINSPGGVVFDARAMKSALERHPANVIAHIDGLAASAASFLMLGANEIVISDGAFVMIHEPWGFAFGTAEEMRDTADMLDKLNDSIVNDYRKATGKSDKEIRDWMEAETWFDADEAVENGFCDRKTEDESEDESASAHAGELVFNLSAFDHAPKALTKPPTKPKNDERDQERARAQALARLTMFEKCAPSA